VESIELIIGIAVVVLVAFVGLVVGLVRRSGGRKRPPAAPRPGVDYAPGVGDDAQPPRDAPKRTVDTLPPPDSVVSPPAASPEPDVLVEPEPAPVLERPEAPAGRLVRLRARLARSNSALGKGLLALLSRDTIDESTWEEVEETLLLADLGVGPTTELVDRLRERVLVLGAREPQQVKEMLTEELLALVGPEMDRSLNVQRIDARPAVVLVVGVNGTGKTTTVGKLARVLVAEDKDVLLGAADTFRAAAADQLETWGARVGVPTIRAERDGADPAAVAFDAVKAGIETEVDVVLLDTAGRLQNKVGLMDELSKVKRVAEKALGPDGGSIDEVLLVLDATTGQNGMRQAQVFSEVVDVTGIVLTKLDGTAKGGIVVAVQRQLGVPVKLVGLGEGPDDLAPFEPKAFVDALLA
jgi:fused signal recognition particle receptor